MSPLFRRRRQDDPAEETGHDEVTDEAGVEEEPEAPADASPEVFDRSRGPWDVSEVESTEGYVDLGAVLVPGRDGMELRLEIDEAADRVTSATVQLEGSAVQLQVFAAPRTEGIWDEIRSEIAAGITRQGGTADEVPGPFGRELIARIPVRTADGRTGHQPARFAGIDGPRWFLRAVFHGLAVHEPEQAAGVEDVVRSLVVVRGAEAMAPRELLSLRLPEQPAPAEPEEPEGAQREPLEPFTRGPEITEIR
ncbi:DUF3710 domain-containing protein [Kineosporia sp. R_H_3]|uniref:DUF3710 domain-containing protein n=1 Tax=Kineosporia sp. R_H_3 TaxID=1961848 RepID=UPI0018E9E54D|nr:DUF3710 domain-containing protein [Kineosporia sp. R_H_3]